MKLIVCAFLIIWSHALCAQIWNEAQKVVASDRSMEASLGASVSIDDNYLVTGSHQRQTNGLDYSGAAYVFESINGVWTESQILAPSDLESYDGFGLSVAIENTTIAVGSPYEDGPLGGEGAAYVFEKNASGVWVEVAKLTQPVGTEASFYAFSLAISGDYIVVGAQDYYQGSNANLIGAAYIYKRDQSGNWNFEQQIIADNPIQFSKFGATVAIDGETIMVNGAGKIHVFQKMANGSWTSVQELTTSDWVSNTSLVSAGRNIAIDGNIALIGDHKNDLDATGGNLLQNSGAAYIFEKGASGVWIETQKVVPSDESRIVDGFFGFSVALNDDWAMIGSPGDINQVGAVYVFRRDDTTWLETEKISGSDSNNGTRVGNFVALDNYSAVLGVPLESEDINGTNTIQDAGAVYIFKPVPNQVEKISKLSFQTSPNPTDGNLNIKLDNIYSEVEVISRNALGQEVSRQTYKNVDAIEFNLEGPKGVYFIELVTPESRIGTKVLKR